MELESFATYDEEAGGFVIIKERTRAKPAGTKAASPGGPGYMQIRMTKLFYEHTLVWLWHYGKYPDFELDHKDGNRSNNKIENLRDVTRTLNSCNATLRSDNTSGYKGVAWDKKSCKWHAYININGKRIHIGYFLTAEEAFEARINFINQHQFGGFTDRHLFNDTDTSQSTNPNLRISL